MTMFRFKPIIPYSLAALPFILVFIYQVGVVWPSRPLAPDATHGLTMAMQTRDHIVYVSQLDMWLAFGSWAAATAIILAGLWKVRKQLSARLKLRKDET